MNLKIRNWDKWQSYRKDRGQPPWIKVHRTLMRDPGWVALTDAQRGQLVAIWMLAADHDGVIPASPALIRKLCFMDSDPDLQTLTDHGFIEGRRRIDAIVTPAGRQPDQPETEKRRVEAEKNVATNGVAARSTKIQEVISAWKIQTNVDPADEAWDKEHYKRHLRPAQSLLNLFSQDVGAVCDCIETVYRQLVEKKGLDLSLQGVVNNSSRFRQDWLEKKAKKDLQRGVA